MSLLKLIVAIFMYKHKPRRIALERQAGRKIFNPAAWISTTDHPLHIQLHSPLGYQSLVCTILAKALLRSENNRDHSKMKNESVKKSLEKSKNVPEEKRKMVKQKT